MCSLSKLIFLSGKFIYLFLFEIDFLGVFKTGLKLPMQSRQASYSYCCCFSLLSAKIISMSYNNRSFLYLKYFKRNYMCSRICTYVYPYNILFSYNFSDNQNFLFFKYLRHVLEWFHYILYRSIPDVVLPFCYSLHLRCFKIYAFAEKDML